MNTSNFSKGAKKPNAVSIAFKSPPSFKGKHFKLLAPPKWLVRKYKRKPNAEEFTKHYYTEVLDKLDPETIYKQLGENTILLCWESKTKFCHRHIISKWFKDKLGIKVTEL